MMQKIVIDTFSNVNIFVRSKYGVTCDVRLTALEVPTILTVGIT